MGGGCGLTLGKWFVRSNQGVWMAHNQGLLLEGYGLNGLERADRENRCFDKSLELQLLFPPVSLATVATIATIFETFCCSRILNTKTMKFGSTATTIRSSQRGGRRPEPFMVGWDRLFLPCLMMLAAVVDVVRAGNRDDCTHGKLYVTDSTSMTIRSLDLDDSSLVVTELSDATVTLQGSPPLYLNPIAESMVLMAAYWGSEEKNMTDGVVNLIHTGVGLENHGDHKHILNGDPYSILNAVIQCGPMYHPHSDQGILAVKCDGFSSSNPPINTTILVFDETLFSASPNATSALVATYRENGSHHGAALPVAPGVILHSVATPEQVLGLADASSLPNTFQVRDYTGDVLYTIANTSDDTQSCFSFHGSAHWEDSFYFACSHNETEHGGILVVEYDASADPIAFTTRSIQYPAHSDLPKHRAGGITSHSASPYIVTDFADWDAEVYAPQMLAFDATATTASADRVLTLGPLGQCEYAFEQALGEWVVVLLPDVAVQVYTPGPEWTLLAEVSIGEGAWDECPWPTPFAVGFMQAFVARDNILYSLDLKDAASGTIGLTTLDLGFAPYSMTVAGVPKGFECKEKGQVATVDNASTGVTPMTWFGWISVLFLWTVTNMM